MIEICLILSFIYPEKAYYEKEDSEDKKYGGVRLTTFMIYLTSVEAGGHTIFPQTGIRVKPELGTALFWFNMGAQNNYDSRIWHLGKKGLTFLIPLAKRRALPGYACDRGFGSSEFLDFF